MVFVRFLMVLVALTAMVGCDTGTTTTTSTDVQQPSPTDNIKSALEQVAETGELDSGLMLVEEQLEEMKSTDAEKAEKLSTALEELKATNGGDAAKAKAKEMLKEL